MRQPKLFCAGCSISDRTQTTHSYGDYLAEMMDYDYVHLAGGGGSNYRSIRQIVQAVGSGEATSDDMIVLQFTDVTRKELNSSFLSGTEHGKKLAKQHVDTCKIRFERHSALLNEGSSERLECQNIDVTPAGVYTRFKNNSEEYQLCEQDQNLHLHYFRYSFDPDLDLQNFMVQFRMLDAFLLFHNIPHVYNWEASGSTILNNFSQYYPGELPIEAGAKSSKHHFIMKEYWPGHRSLEYEKHQTEYHLVPNEDFIHYSILGHKTVARHLHTHIKKYYDK